MNTVTTRDMMRMSTEGPLVATSWDRNNNAWMWGTMGNLGATRTSRRSEGFGILGQDENGGLEILGMPWYLAAGIGAAALLVLPGLLKKL